MKRIIIWECHHCRRHHLHPHLQFNIYFPSGRWVYLKENFHFAIVYELKQNFNELDVFPDIQAVQETRLL